LRFEPLRRAALTAAQGLLLAGVFALGWMKTPVPIGGLPAVASDLLLALSFACLAIAIICGARPRWHRAQWLLLAYFAALALSALFSADPGRSAVKLATQAYLLSLPLLVLNLVPDPQAMRRLFLAWIAGAAVVTALGVATLLLFPFLGWDSILAWPLHHFGTLPPGNYPRLELTFLYPSILANYLAVALMLVLLCGLLGWIRPCVAKGLAAAMAVVAFFALTPGFGAIVLMLAAWFARRWRRTRPVAAAASLMIGVGFALLALPVAAVTPIIHPTAPFVFNFDLAGVQVTLAPAVRMLTWIDAWHRFLDSPLLGRGIGVNAAFVQFMTPEGDIATLTDAHNMFLNVAAQAGVLGLAGIVAILWFAVRRALAPSSDVVFALALAFACSLGVQGLVGSFEDSRHLWLLFGLLLAADSWREQGRGAG